MTKPLTARGQLEQFLSALFLREELIELRFIESWLSQSKKRSRLVRSAEWLRPDDFIAAHSDLTLFARRERANMYFGVCPRAKVGDADDHSIQTIRSVWCDVDHVTADEAHRRWNQAGIPRPSIVVSSGSGIHGYWLLQRDLTSQAERSQFGTMLPDFYRSFGGDHVQNVSRVLRPPGTVNYKDARNGRPPLPCSLCLCDSEVRYPLDTFAPWMPRDRRETPPVAAAPRPRPGIDTSTVHPEATTLISRLDCPCRDRSRRDFAIVCDLLRLGLSREEIWSLVASLSKFESDGRPYFDLTVTNAERVLQSGPASRSPLRSAT
ncbi:MAG: hypothetical protein GXY83_42895 [Rhodopirellula sp.]|nr:hypothetical protein [Rhodopirellula sp.]